MADKKTLSERLEDIKNETEVEQSAKPEPKKTEKPVQTRKFEPSETVEIMNNSSGTLYYKSKKTGLEWKFENHGDTDYMEIQELQAMRSSQPLFFKNAWIKVLDEEAVNF